MYRPHVNTVDDELEIRGMVAGIGTAELITVGVDGYPLATLLPIVWSGDTVVAHFARANEHWRAIDGATPALLVCTGADAYVSPSWYASKAEHGRVVPTWNYSSVHLVGRVRVHDDADWVRAAVTSLTERNEEHRTVPWRVSDAPERFVDGQLRAIVGVEFTVERVEAKAKLSQNRSAADRQGVIAGMRHEGTPGSRSVADAMDAH